MSNSEPRDLIPQADLPAGFVYPPQFLMAMDDGLSDLVPWRILYGPALRRAFGGLNERYAGRDIVPFAARQDNDDVACWERGSSRVVIIHDFASPGWERRGSFEDFHAWLRQAVEDYIDFHHTGH